jgi:hypothetical protein
MFRLLAGILMLVAATDAVAARPSTLGMSCRQAQNLLAKQGAVVMSTGRHTYERFVSHPGYCMTAEFAYSATAPTKDSPSCRLGYICNTAPPLWHDRPGDHWLFDR